MEILGDKGVRRFLLAVGFLTYVIPSLGGELVVLAEQAAVREAAQAKATTLVTLPRDATLMSIERKGNWWHVSLPDGRTGWVFAALVGSAAHPKMRGLVPDDELESLVGDYWLLAIGIDQYTHWPILQNAVHDATAVVKILNTEYGFKREHTIELYDQQATEENVINTFVELQKKMQPKDALLIYYAGHGIVDNFNTGSWIPVNARQGQIADYISTDRLTRMIGTLSARHVFLVADACFSGSLFASRGLRYFEETDRYFREIVKRTSRQALTSGGIEEVADGGAEGHSIFAYHFIQELRHNHAPYFAASKLSASVKQLVARNASQEPRWSHLREAGDEDGEFFFLRSGVAASDKLALAAQQLKVSSDPEGATVLVDGEVVGTTPMSLSGLAGRVVVTVAKEGFDDAVEDVVIRMDRTQNVSFNLSPVAGTGQIVITSNPDEAAWYFDGGLMGKTPDQVGSLALGTHRVRVVKPGYAPWEQSIDLIAGQPAELRAEMQEVNVPITAVKAEQVPPLSAAPAPMPTAMAGSRAEVQDFREVETRLREFVTAYLNRDLSRVDQVATLSPDNRNLLEHLFSNYKTVVVRVANHSVSGSNARASLQIERLVRNNGDEVHPSARWKQADVTLTKENGQWGMIQW